MKKPNKSTLLRILVILFVLFVLVQFIPVTRNNPTVTADMNGPTNVKTILKESCYDCHSNETQWPWYSNVAPVSWMVAHHVDEGRMYLNFSEWETLTDNQKNNIKQHIVKQVELKKMPLWPYPLTHANAVVDSSELNILSAWAEQN